MSLYQSELANRLVATCEHAVNNQLRSRAIEAGIGHVDESAPPDLISS